MNNPRDPVLNFIPEEVLLQILARLSIRSICRAKFVCKLWYKLISERYFIQLYNNISVKNAMVLVDVTESSPESISSLICVDLRGVSACSLNFVKDRVKVRASCNGLLCCSSIADKGVYYVCNPMTKEFKLLPRSRKWPVTRFYPEGEAVLVGLACDLETHKYSVVLAGYHWSSGPSPERNFVCLVYDSESNKWRKFVSLQDDQFTHMNRNQVVFTKNALHWLTESHSFLLVLKLNDDIWRKIYLPKEVSSSVENKVYLLESDGCLSVIQISEDLMSIWVMKDYEREEWHLVDQVSLRCIISIVPAVYPISQMGEYVFLATHDLVLVYQRDTRVWQEMYRGKNTYTKPLWFSAHAFRSSLFPC